jgi:methionyl aminopeptidase
VLFWFQILNVCLGFRCITEIGDLITEIASKAKLGIVHEYCGHGVGPVLHLPPLVKHFKNQDKFEIKEGMVFTIEPILGKF